MEQQIDFNSPLDDILKGKAKYHSDQIEFHKAKLSEVNSLIGNGQPKPEIQTPKPKPIPTSHSKTKRRKKTTSVFPQIMPQDAVKPYIIEFLSNGGKHVTTEIFDYISTKTDTTKNERRSWVTAISLCLSNLSKGRNPKVKKSDTDKGNVKAYEWIDDDLG